MESEYTTLGRSCEKVNVNLCPPPQPQPGSIHMLCIESIWAKILDTPTSGAGSKAVCHHAYEMEPVASPLVSLVQALRL